jgi:hypothetical protein
MTKKIDLRERSNSELSLLVFNISSLYVKRHEDNFDEYLRSQYIFTETQMEVLRYDLKADLEEIERNLLAGP